MSVQTSHPASGAFLPSEIIRQVDISDIEMIPPETTDGPAGLALEVDGEVKVLGFFLWIGHQCWVFFDVRDETYRSPFLLHRLGRQLIKSALVTGEPFIVAACDDTIPNSEKWLKRLGFVKSQEVVEKKHLWVLING